MKNIHNMIPPNTVENKPLRIIHISPLIFLRKRMAVIISVTPTKIDHKLMLAQRKLAITILAMRGEIITTNPAIILRMPLKRSQPHHSPFLILRTPDMIPNIPSINAYAPKTIVRASIAETGKAKAKMANIRAKIPLTINVHQFLVIVEWSILLSSISMFNVLMFQKLYCSE